MQHLVKFFGLLTFCLLVSAHVYGALPAANDPFDCADCTGARNGVTEAHEEVVEQVGRQYAAVYFEPWMIPEEMRDDRRSDEEFARDTGRSVEEVRTQYAASGQINCGGTKSAVQLVMRDNLVVFSAHAWVNPANCSKHSNVEDCEVTFENPTGTGTQTAKIGRLIDAGFTDTNNCSPPPAARPAPELHWAVAELDRPISDVITPYNVDIGGLQSINTGQFGTPIVAVNSGRQLDFRKRDLVTGRPIQDPVTGRFTYPESYANTCRVMDTRNMRLLRTTCDGANGASGGGLFNDADEIPTLLGIRMGGTETTQMLLDATATPPVNLGHWEGLPADVRNEDGQNIGNFNLTQWHSVYVPLNGDFLSALAGAVQ